MIPAPLTLVVGGIGELVTCDPDRAPAPGVIEDAVLAAAGERIVWCGPAADFRAAQLPRDPACVEIDARGAAVIPGFVDSHTHLVWMGERSAEYAMRAAGSSYEEIAARGGGIRSTVAATAATGVDELAAAARRRAARMLRLGTTTVEIKSGYGLELDAELRQLEAARRVRGPDMPSVVATYLPLHALPAGDRAAHVDAVCRLGLSAARGLARFVDAFCDAGAYSVAECERVLSAATAAGYGVRLHAEQRSHSGAALLAARLDAAAADHLEHADDADLRALAAAGCVAGLLPGASLLLDGPPPPGRRALDAGCTIAIATDCNPGTCWSESMPLMLSLAVATAGLTPAEALVAATTGGAAALRLTDRGMLRAGLRCDGVMLHSSRWLDIAYHLGGDEVGEVVLAGRVARGAVDPPIGPQRGLASSDRS